MTYSRKPSGPGESMQVLSWEELKDLLEAAGMEVGSAAEPSGFKPKLRRFGRLCKEIGLVLPGKSFRRLLKSFVLLGATELGLLGVLRVLAPGGFLRALVAGLFHFIGLYGVLAAGYLLSVIILYAPLFGGARIVLGPRRFTPFLHVSRIVLLLLTLASPLVFFMPLPWHTGAAVDKLYTFTGVLGVVLAGLHSIGLSKRWES